MVPSGKERVGKDIMRVQAGIERVGKTQGGAEAEGGGRGRLGLLGLGQLGLCQDSVWFVLWNRRNAINDVTQ